MELLGLDADWTDGQSSVTGALSSQKLLSSSELRTDIATSLDGISRMPGGPPPNRPRVSVKFVREPREHRVHSGTNIHGLARVRVGPRTRTRGPNVTPSASESLSLYQTSAAKRRGRAHRPS